MAITQGLDASRTCARCDEPLEISQAAHALLSRLATSERPLLCAECAVDGGKNTSSGDKVQNGSYIHAC
jgi:hypothetical protein